MISKCLHISLLIQNLNSIKYPRVFGIFNNLLSNWCIVKQCVPCIFKKESAIVYLYISIWNISSFISGNPLVSVKYLAIRSFSEVIPSKCDNISSRLDSMKEMLEKTIAERCYLLNVSATVQFTYSFLSFQVYFYVYTNRFPMVFKVSYCWSILKAFNLSIASSCS